MFLGDLDAIGSPSQLTALRRPSQPNRNHDEAMIHSSQPAFAMLALSAFEADGFMGWNI